LESLIQKKPNLQSIGKTGNVVKQTGKDVMTRFLSRSSGFKYLGIETNFVATELQAWKETEHIAYVVRVEKNLQELANSFFKQQKPSKLYVVFHLSKD
jgi:hypothetical protein